jgi:hypothetical protein
MRLGRWKNFGVPMQGLFQQNRPKPEVTKWPQRASALVGAAIEAIIMVIAAATAAVILRSGIRITLLLRKMSCSTNPVSTKSVPLNSVFPSEWLFIETIWGFEFDHAQSQLRESALFS